MASGGFELRKWKKTERNNAKTSVNEPLKITGLVWDKFKDTLFFEVPNIDTIDLLVTRRNMLSIIQEVSDPIGFSTPVTLIPKLYLQMSLKTKSSWDAELPEDIRSKFFKCLKKLHLLSTVKVPRQTILTEGQFFSLYTCSDSSQGSYASIIF